MFPISNDMKMKINKIQNNFDGDKIFDWDVEESFIATPFIITLGTQNATEAGYVPDIGDDITVNPTSRGYFEQIFTGREPILAQWEGQSTVPGNSTTIITQDPNSQKYEPNVKRDFAIGRSIRVWSQLTQAGTSFGASGGFSGQTSTRNIVCFTNETFNEADEYKIYLIPTLAQEQWLYVKDVQRYYMPDKTYSHSLITFDTLMDSLEISGTAQEEYVQRSSPGDAYAWPKITTDTNGIEQVQLDPTKLIYQPITDVQIQFFGVVGFSQMNFRARPVFKGDDFHTVRSSRLVLPYQLNTPIPDQVSSNVIPEQNYYYVALAQPTIISNYDNWKERIEARYDQTQKKNYEGDLITNYSNSVASNPIVNNASKYNMWDTTFLFNTPQNYILNVAGNGYCNGGFLDGGKNIGNTFLHLDGKSLAFKEFNASNFMYHNQHTLLSLGDQQRTVWSIKDIPVLGWELDKFVGGYPAGWYNSTNNPYTTFDGINLLISATLYTQYTSALYQLQKNQGFIPLDVFRDEADGIGAIAGFGSTTETFNFNLTDMLNFQRKYDIDGATVPFSGNKSSIFLGQRDDDLSSYYLYDQDTLVAPKNTNVIGYVVDLSSFQALGKCDYKITFYSNTQANQTNNAVWTGRYTSNSKYADNIRQWTTIIPYTDMPDPGFKLPWPLPLPQPALNNNKTFNLNYKIDSNYANYENRASNSGIYNSGSQVSKINLDLTLGVDISKFQTLNISWEMGNVNNKWYIPPVDSYVGFINNQIDISSIQKFDINSITQSNFQTVWKTDMINQYTGGYRYEGDAAYSSKVTPSGLNLFENQFRGEGFEPNTDNTIIGFSSVLWNIVQDTNTSNYFLVMSADQVTGIYYEGNVSGFSDTSDYDYTVINQITLSGNPVNPGLQSKTWNLDPKFGMILNTPAAIPTLTQSAANGTDFGNYIEANTGFPITGIDYYDLSYEIDYYDKNGTLIKTDNQQVLHVGASLPNPSGGVYGMYNGVSPIVNWADKTTGSGSFVVPIYLPADTPYDTNNEPTVGDYLNMNDFGANLADVRTQTTLLMNNSKTTGKIEWNMVGTLNSTPSGGQPYGTVVYKPKTITAYWGK